MLRSDERLQLAAGSQTHGRTLPGSLSQGKGNSSDPHLGRLGCGKSLIHYSDHM